MINQRLSVISGLNYAVFEGPACASVIKSARALLDGKIPSELKYFEDASPDTIRGWLADKIDGKAKVNIAWISCNQAAEIHYDDFVRHYEDIWYPGSDDIIVYSEESPVSLLITHEEEFYSYVQ